MTPEAVIHIINELLMATFWLAAPLLLIGFAVGILTNLVQVATSLQDSSISTIPRLLAFFAGFLLMMPWMLKKLSAYAITLFSDLGRYAR